MCRLGIAWFPARWNSRGWRALDASLKAARDSSRATKRHSITSFPFELFFFSYSLTRTTPGLAAASVKVETAKVDTLGNSHLLEKKIRPAKLPSTATLKCDSVILVSRDFSRQLSRVLSYLFLFIFFLSKCFIISLRNFKLWNFTESEVDNIGSLSGLISIFIDFFSLAIFLSLLDRNTDNKNEECWEVINYIEIFALCSFLNFFSQPRLRSEIADKSFRNP